MRNEHLVLENANLVWAVIYRHFPTFYYDEDIYQAGMLGLCRAADAYEPEKGTFATLAWKCIYHEIVREFRARQRWFKAESLDVPLFLDKEDGETLLDRVEGRSLSEYSYLDDFKKKLSLKEQTILDGLMNLKNQRELAEELGVSRSRVSGIVYKIQLKWLAYEKEK